MLFIKIEAIRFLYRFCDKLNYENLKHYIHNNTAIRIRAYTEDPDLTDSLIPNEASNGFIYPCEEMISIFINEELNDSKKTETLLHEFCHFIKHSYSFSYTEKPRKREELEAENFVFYTLKYHKTVFPIALFLKKYALASVLAGFLIFSYLPNQQAVPDEQVTTPPELIAGLETFKTETDSETITADAAIDTTVYVTPTGTRYHKADCQYVNPNTATEMTIEEAQTEYLPCKRCKPNNS